MHVDSYCNRSIATIALQLALVCVTVPSASGTPPITAVAFAPDGKHVLLGSQAGIEVRSWPELKVVKKTIPTDLVHVHDLAFAPDGRHLLAAGGSPAEQGAVEVLSWPDGKVIERVSKHDDLVYRVAWSPDGNEWATAGADGICQVFSRDTSELLVRYTGHSRAVLALCYLPDGKAIASAGADQTIHLWDSHSGIQLRTLDNHLATVNDLSIRPMRPAESGAGKRSAASLPLLASVSDDRTVRLWQPTIGRLVRFARLPAIGHAVAWTPSGDRILVGCNDGLVRVIDPENAAVNKQLTGFGQQRIFALAPEPSGVHVLAAGDGQPFKLEW